MSDERLQFRLSIHESADVAAATETWAQVVGCAPDRFERPSLKRHNPVTVRRNTSVAYVGCCVVRVRRSVELNQRIAGWWAGIVDATVGTIGPPSGMV